MTTMYLRTKIKGGGDAEASIRNVKVFAPEWPDPVGPKPAPTKAMLQVEYGTRAERVEKMRIKLST